jgi:peptide/nickel transport system permease protein
MRKIVFQASLFFLVLFHLASFAAPFLAPFPPERQFRDALDRPPQLMFFGSAGWISIEDEEGAVPIDWLAPGFPYSLAGVSTSIHLYGPADSERPVFLLGTDSLGRDLWSRLWYALRFSTLAGLTGAVFTLFFGTVAGSVSGFVGGWVDVLFMRLCDFLLSLPGLFLVLGLRAAFPVRLEAAQVFWMVVLIFVLIGWGSVTRVVRGLVLSLKERPHVMAARLIGASDLRLLLRHILPFAWGNLVVQFTVFIPLFILGEVTISFLGVGVQEPDVSLGTMLGASSSLAVIALHPWQLLVPAGALFLLVLAYNLVSDRLRAVQPSARWW